MKLRLLTLLAMLTLLAYPVAASPAATNCVKHPKHCLTPIVAPTQTPEQAATALPAPTKHSYVIVTPTAAGPTAPTPATNQGQGVPYPGAPLCAAHDNATYHSLWNSALGCHYDHEHGTSPFTPAVAQVFAPLGDLQTMLGGVQIGHTNPSSPAENTSKHGGFKWQVDIDAPQGCAVGFESGTSAIDAYAIQYHAFGPQSIEFEARQHSTVSFLRQCQGAAGDYGYIFLADLQDYGERCLPYQGQTLQYPDNFEPQWDCSFGPYFTTEGVPLVRSSLSYYNGSLARNNLSIWTSKRTGAGSRPPTSTLFDLLFRLRDGYQVLDTTDLAHPFHWLWLCSADNGATYRAAGCRYNNSTTTIHEIAGTVPPSWDNLAEWDTDPRPGRITVEGFVDALGQPTAVCHAPGVTCYPVKYLNAFVGKYSSEISLQKVSNPTPLDTPERDLYFCGGMPCAEGSLGAVPSGWVGPSN